MCRKQTKHDLRGVEECGSRLGLPVFETVWGEMCSVLISVLLVGTTTARWGAAAAAAAV